MALRRGTGVLFGQHPSDAGSVVRLEWWRARSDSSDNIPQHALLGSCLLGSCLCSDSVVWYVVAWCVVCGVWSLVIGVGGGEGGVWCSVCGVW